MSAPSTQLEIVLAGRTRHVELREPATGESIALVLDKDIRTPDLVEQRLAWEVYRLIDRIDGEEPDWDEAVAVARDAEALGRVLHVRNALYNYLANEGRALAFCPFCSGPPAILDLAFYWLVLRLPKWDFFDRGVLMHLPSLSSSLPAGKRPAGAPLARQLGFRMPEDPPREGLLHAATAPDVAARERDFWSQYAPDGEDPPDEHPHWRRNSPGFRAILRLAAALNPNPPARR